MKKFYFVGGPKTGQAEEFFRRLNQIGGSPSGWCLYPHADHSGKALHLIDAESQDDIIRHLEHFQGIYECSEIVEIIGRQ